MLATAAILPVVFAYPTIQHNKFLVPGLAYLLQYNMSFKQGKNTVFTNYVQK